MKRHYLIAFSVSLLINLGLGVYVVSKSHKNTKPIFHPFDINFNITHKSLEKEGYELIPEDVTIFGKRMGDTLIYYVFDMECKAVKFLEGWSEIEDSTYFIQYPLSTKCKIKEPYFRNFEINLKGFDSLEVVSIFEKYPDVYIISDWDMNSPRFFVRYLKTNLIYHCSIYKYTEDDWVLGISCHFPTR